MTEHEAVVAMARRYERAAEPIAQTDAMFALEEALSRLGEPVRTESYNYAVDFETGELAVRRIDGRHPEGGRR